MATAPAVPGALVDLALAGSTIVVTGAGSGIGAATAHLLGAAGACVMLVGRREELLRRSADAITETGGRAAAVPADLADPASPGRIIDAALAAFGRVDGLVNNAARCQHRPLSGWDPAGIRVNCIAPGPFDTPIHASWADNLEEAYRWLKSQVPLGRIGDPAEIARWIALLLSPVSSFMTGALIPLDGGQVIPHA